MNSPTVSSATGWHRFAVSVEEHRIYVETEADAYRLFEVLARYEKLRAEHATLQKAFARQGVELERTRAR
jgi:hypothetical protein